MLISLAASKTPQKRDADVAFEMNTVDAANPMDAPEFGSDELTLEQEKTLQHQGYYKGLFGIL